MYTDIIINAIKSKYNPNIKELDKCIDKVAKALAFKLPLTNDTTYILQQAQVFDHADFDAMHLILLAARYLRVSIPEAEKMALVEAKDNDLRDALTALFKGTSRLALLPMASVCLIVQTVNDIYNRTGVNLYETWDLEKLPMSEMIPVVRGISNDAAEILSYWLTLTGRVDVFKAGTTRALVGFIDKDAHTGYRHYQNPTQVAPSLHSPNPAFFQQRPMRYGEPAHHHASPMSVNGFPTGTTRLHLLDNINLQIHPAEDKPDSVAVVVAPCTADNIATGVALNVLLSNTATNEIYETTVYTVRGIQQWVGKLNGRNANLTDGNYVAKIVLMSTMEERNVDPIRFERRVKTDY